MNRKVSLIIPSLDPDEKLLTVVSDAIAGGFDDIILVDDGSRDENKIYFEKAAEHGEVTVLTHDVNRGKGAALKTAFAFFSENRPGYNGVVTADSDGQHCIKDIIACADAMMSPSPAIILGVRDFSLPNVPKKSRFGNRATSLVFRLFCGMKISDTQTGLRAIPSCYLPAVSKAAGTRYEFETNMLLLMNSEAIPYREVTIKTVYYDNNSKSHFRPIRDSIRVYGLIIKYAASSLFSSFADLLAFFCFCRFIFTGGEKLDILLATVIARCTSNIINFICNKKLVFEDSGSVARTFLRYICLSIPLMTASWLLVYFFSSIAAIDSEFVRTVLIKMPVDVALFIISFRIQRTWVFKKN